MDVDADAATCLGDIRDEVSPRREPQSWAQTSCCNHVSRRSHRLQRELRRVGKPFFQRSAGPDACDFLHRLERPARRTGA
jgi:hypothetical protein